MRGFERLLDLPMRDGNTSTWLRSASVGLTFRPSYEGWKRYIYPEGAMGPGAFRPSYEGWKRYWCE